VKEIGLVTLLLMHQASIEIRRVIRPDIRVCSAHEC